jgi:SPP1 gp7 family putative phage head morphogenesis protein
VAYDRIPHDIMSSEVPHDQVRGDEQVEVAFSPIEVTVASAADDVQLVPQPDGTREPQPIVSDRQAAVPTRQALDQALDILEAKATSVVLDALTPVMVDIADRIAESLSTAGLTAAAVDDLTSILDDWGQAVDQSVLPYYQEVYRLGGMSAVAQMVELGGAVPSDFERLTEFHMEGAARHLAVARDRFMQVGNEAWQESRIVMLQGLEQGYGVDRIAEDIRGVVSLTEADARMVARTEVISAANAGAFDQAKLAGEDAPLYKQWLATMDRRTRPSHDAADGQVVPLNDAFSVGGATLLYPGDPAAPAAQVINCRCTIIFTDDPAGLSVAEGGRQVGGVVEDVAETA